MRFRLLSSKPGSLFTIREPGSRIDLLSLAVLRHAPKIGKKPLRVNSRGS